MLNNKNSLIEAHKAIEVLSDQVRELSFKNAILTGTNVVLCEMLGNLSYIDDITSIESVANALAASGEMDNLTG